MMIKMRVLTPSASIGVIDGRVDVTKVDLAHEAIDLSRYYKKNIR